MGIETIRELCLNEGLQAIVVPDTSVLMKNPDLTKWSFDFACVAVISDMVFAELETHKGRSGDRQPEADAARRVLSSLAGIAKSSLA